MPTDHVAPPESVWTYAVRTADRFAPTRLHLNIGIGTHAYERFFPDRPVPVGLREFRERTSADGEHHFPSTGGDIFLHVKSSQYDLILTILECARFNLADQLAEGGFHERHCFSSIDGRNQFGYFDATSDASNTANPTLDIGPLIDAYPYSADVYDPSGQHPAGCTEESLHTKKEAARCGLVVDAGKIATTFIGAEDPDHLNGSFAMVQEYIHDLPKFNALSSDEQDRVFGRQKESGALYGHGEAPLGGGLNEELPRAHIVRAHVRATGPNGEADMDPCVQNPPGASLAPLQIYRQAGSFGTATGDKGLFFMAYCRYAETFDHMLDRMIGHSVTWPGSAHDVDHLLEFTRAVSGQYFYMPNLAELTSLARFPQPE